MQQQPNIEHIFVCVGGGGLISGLAIGAKSVKPDVNIIGMSDHSAVISDGFLRHMTYYC